MPILLYLVVCTLMIAVVGRLHGGELGAWAGTLAAAAAVLLLGLLLGLAVRLTQRPARP